MQFAATLIAALSLAFVASASPAKRDTHSGDATFFYQNGNAGSCGQVHSDSDYIVAMPSWLHQAVNCGDYIQVTRGSSSIKAQIADDCPTCDGYHIDLSVGAFTALATESEGEVPVTWYKI
ncbi:hypothetical protein CBS101457_006841 [Exobasidium rhododendri]|nr:hypothetical protein CBS101457_006841 [Exobasidium rhododendri]